MAFTTDESSNTLFIFQNLNMLSMERNLRNEKFERASYLMIFFIHIYTPHPSLISLIGIHTYSLYVSMFLLFISVKSRI